MLRFRLARSWAVFLRMPNIKQQKRRVRTAARQRSENLRYRSTAKTLYKRLEVAVEDGDADAVAAAHRELVRCLDRAAAPRADPPEQGGPQEVAGRPRLAAEPARPARPQASGMSSVEGALELELAGEAARRP